MMIVPAGVKVHLALGYTDMRKGMDGLAALVQEQLKRDPFSGHLFAFRGKRASILKVLFWDGNGLCLFTKRIDRGGFVWPRMYEPGGAVTLSPAQLAMLIEGAWIAVAHGPRSCRCRVATFPGDCHGPAALSTHDHRGRFSGQSRRHACRDHPCHRHQHRIRRHHRLLQPAGYQLAARRAWH